MSTGTTPTERQDLPNFLEPALADMQADLKLALDCWNSLKGCKSEYLPSEEHEPAKAYNDRLNRTRFDNRFKPAITSHAGLLTEFVIAADAPETFKAAQENIDLQGNDLVSFWQQADQRLLRDGGCWILIEYPKEDPNIRSNADLIASGRRPYLQLIDRRNLLNWLEDTIGGKSVLGQATIAEYVKVKNGLFGSKVETRYRMLTPGRFDICRIKDDQLEWLEDLSGETDINFIPLIWYGTDNAYGKGDLPFINLAGLNIEHVQKRSDLNNILHKCNMPVPVRKGLIRTVADLAKEAVKLIIGANSAIDVPSDGDFFFAEPSGNAIAASQADIEKLESAMDRESLAFLSGGEVEKTATEAFLDSAQIRCSIKTTARRKENAMQSVINYWAAYTKEALPKGAGVTVNERVLEPPASSQDAQLILDKMGVSFSNRLGLQMLLQRKWLPPDTDIEAELKQIEQIDTKPLYTAVGGDS